METAFGWLGEIFHALISLIPKLILIKTTHAGVKFKCGREIHVLQCDNGLPFIKKFSYKWPFIKFHKTGVHLYWPVVTECIVVPVKRQTTNLVPQYLCTLDNKSIGVSGIVVYEIIDVEKLLTECFDYEDTIRDLSLASIKVVVTSYTLPDLQRQSDAVDKELTLELRKELSRFGIRTIRVTLTDLTPCRMIGLWGSAVTVDMPPQPYRSP